MSDALDDLPLFRGLGPEQMAGVRARFHDVSHPAGTVIIAEDAPGDSVFVVVSGAVKVHISAAEHDVILAVLGPGQVVGEMSVVDALGRSANVTALEDSRMLEMDRAEFWQMLSADPVTTVNLAGTLSRRVRMANDHIEMLTALDVGGRLARVFLSLAREYGRPPVTGPGTLIPIPLTQSDLGAMVGASRVRVNQVMGNFRTRGLISADDRHRVTVLDEAALEKRCR